VAGLIRTAMHRRSTSRCVTARAGRRRRSVGQDRFWGAPVEGKRAPTLKKGRSLTFRAFPEAQQRRAGRAGDQRRMVWGRGCTEGFRASPELGSGATEDQEGVARRGCFIIPPFPIFQCSKISATRDTSVPTPVVPVGRAKISSPSTGAASVLLEEK